MASTGVAGGSDNGGSTKRLLLMASIMSGTVMAGLAWLTAVFLKAASGGVTVQCLSG